MYTGMPATFRTTYVLSCCVSSIFCFWNSFGPFSIFARFVISSVWFMSTSMALSNAFMPLLLKISVWIDSGWTSFVPVASEFSYLKKMSPLVWKQLITHKLNLPAWMSVSSYLFCRLYVVSCRVSLKGQKKCVKCSLFWVQKKTREKSTYFQCASCFKCLSALFAFEWTFAGMRFLVSFQITQL